ncbi:hypothetical protein [Bradyrhizobium sp. SYSU BS000235]|uniref:hypothetical protein n=1 Tax=Bradyrhizobium sp. SYSU BS000235 TaxID=3411332 RepID=UPI003C72E5CF
MIKTILTILMLCMAGSALADDVQPSNDARPSMPYFGTARMESDGTIILQLTRTADGKPYDSTQTYKTTDRAYDSIKRHTGLRPGTTRELRPWKD